MRDLPELTRAGPARVRSRAGRRHRQARSGPTSSSAWGSVRSSTAGYRARSSRRCCGYQNPFAVIIATAIGVPMYADIFGTLPIAEALVAKGVAIWAPCSSFMMAVTALSLAVDDHAQEGGQDPAARRRSSASS